MSLDLRSNPKQKQNLDKNMQTDKKQDKELRAGNIIFLTLAGDEIEARIIEGLLNSNNIPVMKKYSFDGEFMGLMMGNYWLGIELYVPEEEIEKAKEILEHSFDESMIINEYEKMEYEKESEYFEENVTYKFERIKKMQSTAKWVNNWGDVFWFILFKNLI